MKSATLEFFY